MNIPFVITIFLQVVFKQSVHFVIKFRRCQNFSEVDQVTWNQSSRWSALRNVADLNVANRNHQIIERPLTETVALSISFFVIDSEGNQFGSHHRDELERFLPLTNVAVDLGKPVASADSEVFEVAHSFFLGTISVGQREGRFPRTLLVRRRDSFAMGSARRFWTGSRRWIVGWFLSIIRRCFLNNICCCPFCRLKFRCCFCCFVRCS